MMNMAAPKATRQGPQVHLRKARSGSFADEDGVVLTLGLSGARFEHRSRLSIGTVGTFLCGPLIARGRVLHSILLPSRHGIVYWSGIGFSVLTDDQEEQLQQMLLDDAHEQFLEWEANVKGASWRPKPAPSSAVINSYVVLRKTLDGWSQAITLDPNQPVDGITVPEDTPADELEVLRRTYDASDQTARDLMRRMAMVGVMARLH
jgi:hypothetical protein